jgi:hypothetical protein
MIPPILHIFTRSAIEKKQMTFYAKVINYSLHDLYKD